MDIPKQHLSSISLDSANHFGGRSQQGQSLRIAIGCLMALAALVGCRRVDVATWTEEVLLHDGRTIRVERVARTYHSGFPNARRGSNIDYELTYKPLDVHWHSQAPGTLMSFEIFDGVPYLVSYADGRLICRGAQKGRYKARFFKWQGGEWQEILQSTYPTSEGLKNLYEGYWGYSAEEDARGLITWIQKATRDGFDARNPYTIRSWHELSHRICKST